MSIFEYDEEFHMGIIRAEEREEGIAIGIKKGIKQGVEQGIRQGVEQGLKQGVEQGIKQGAEQGLKQGVEQGIKQGMEQGEKRTSENITMRMLKQSQLSLQQIAEYVGLSVEEVEKLAERERPKALDL